LFYLYQDTFPMKGILLFLMVVCFVRVQCQTMDEAYHLYAEDKFDSAKAMTFKMLNDDSAAAEANLLLGRIFVDQKKCDTAMRYLLASISLDKDISRISGWSHAYLGKAFAMTGKKERAISELNKAIALNKTINSVKVAKDALHELFQPPWVRDALDLYQQRKYEQAKGMAFSRRNDTNSAKEANFIIGKIYVVEEKYDSAIPYLQLAIKLVTDTTYVSGWSYAYLGKAHVLCGEKEKGISELNSAIELNITKSSAQYSREELGLILYNPSGQNQDKLNYVSLGPHWIMMEGAHITYYFQDTTNRTNVVKRYIHQHEQAYEQINKTFQATLAKKMVFYVWFDRQLAKQLLSRDLGFTSPRTFTTNAAINQSIGHEMTHTLSYWGWGSPTISSTRFINEGVAVAFDLYLDDKNVSAQKAIAGKNIHSVLDIWNDAYTDEDIVYPVGGAFVSYLYNKCTPEQFKAIIKDQTIENAQKTLGDKAFETLVTDFNQLIGFQ